MQGIKVLVATLSALFICSAGIALAQSTPEDETGLPTPEDIAAAIESGDQAAASSAHTNPESAEGVPLKDLGRVEAVELLQGVFSPELQSTAGIFDELQVEKFLAPNVAVIAGTEPSTTVLVPQEDHEVPSEGEEEPEQSPPLTEKEELRAEPSAVDDGESKPEDPNASSMGEPAELANAALLDSTVPLRTKDPSGKQEAVDLSLQRVEGELQPTNPLVEVDVPERLGEGIELPAVGVQIKLAGAPSERNPSTVDKSVAVYPNVAENIDFAVAPTPSGVETLTQIRSAESPKSQTFELNLPTGATLQVNDEGGAAVTHGESTLVGISPPTAIDARGAEVPVSVGISGNSLTMTVSPDESTMYPILVDPLFQTYEWTTAKSWQDGICNDSFEFHSSNSCNYREEWGISSQAGQGGGGVAISQITGQFWGEAPLYVPQGTPGLFIRSQGAAQGSGGWGGWIYTVPRYFTDQEKYKKMPTSYIGHMTLSKLLWQAYSSGAGPYLLNGIWDPVHSEWVSSYSHTGAAEHGLNNMSEQYQFGNENQQTHQPNSNAKIAQVSIAGTEAVTNGNTDVYVGSASVELEDKDIPQQPVVPTTPSPWVNQTPTSLVFSTADTGLGVRAVIASTEQLGSDGMPLHSWKASYGCIGVADAPCPRTWSSTETGHPALKYEPSVLPTGINYLNVVAEDPVGNKSSAASAQVRVDHVAPVLALSGSMTEQSTLGTKRPIYTLKTNAADGTAEQPQSGVAKVSVEVDGKVVSKSEPGCATENCAIPLEWQLASANYSAGQHTLKVTATDAVGLATTKTLAIELHPSAPSLALSGTMTEQGTLGTTRPRYGLKVSTSAEAGLEGSPPTPTFNSSFGSSGSGNGQFVHPGDVAVDAKGNFWIVDESNNRVQEFNAKGEYVAQFGSSGSGNGQLSRPTSIAIDAKGNLWVTDAANRRVEKFSEKGEYLAQFGSLGTGNGQFAGGGPEGIAIDAKGDIWVSDTYGARIEEFTEAGAFIKAVGTRGSATGQLLEPTGVDIGPGGNVWVADWANNRVEVYNEAGEFVRQFGSEGTGNAQFKRPDALAIDSKGDVWVGDQNNERVQEFNQNGEYLAQFGSAGSGNGQFSFGYPMGIAVDTKGNLWVTDTGNNRVQKWVIPNYVPSYSSAFGTEGTGSGQLKHPADVAIDAQRNLYVADKENNRIEKFNSAGEFVKAFGSYGTGNGQLNGPSALAIDPEGHIWVVDEGNYRVEEFGSEGEYLGQFGSSGTGTGKFVAPEGIAIDPKGNIWVTNSILPSRVQKFNSKGEFVKVIGLTGTGPGQFSHPAGIAADAKGNFWVADQNNHRVEMFNEAGEFVRQWQGSGETTFMPSGIDVDPNGTVWVSDIEHSRVEGFSEYGQLLTQFGVEGTGNGQFKPGAQFGLQADLGGDIWVVDSANNRIERWNWSRNWQSEIATEITVDGKRVDSGEAGCISEHCPIQREWTLESSALPAGKHSVVVKATDSFGNTATKTLPIEIQRDTTKPTLEASGTLFEAPEGWVEQQTYSLTGKAEDSGFGVTQQKLVIDGSQAGISTQTCVNGGCTMSHTFTVNTASYPGGAHEAELIATDGTGNTTAKKWTINVDPKGHVSTAEVIETVEAAETTGVPEVLQSGDEEESLKLEADGGTLTGVEGSVPIEINQDPARGVGLEILEGDAFGESCEAESSETCESPPAETPGLVPIEVVPTASSGGATEVVLAPEEETAVSGNTSTEADTLVRPIYDGDLTFEMIRNASAPESYSWAVQLGGGATLKLESPQYAEVYYAGGHPAFGISAEAAHDAVGTTVPTELSVSEGDVLTLTVKHRSASFVYPIVAGTGWEGGFTTEVVKGPPDEKEIREEEERIAREKQEEIEREWGEGLEPTGESGAFWYKQLPENSWVVAETGPSIVGAPEYEGRGDATSSSVIVPPSIVSRPFKAPACWHLYLHVAVPFHPHEDAGKCKLSPNVMTRGWVHGHFHYELEPHKEVWWNGGREGEIKCGVDYLHNAEWAMWPKECHFSGENFQKGAGSHIVAKHFWRVETANGFLNQFGYQIICLPMFVDLYQTGNVSESNWWGGPGAVRFVGSGEACPWPS